MWLLMHINEHTSGWESAFVCLDRPLSYRIIVPSRAACEHLNVCGVELTVSKVVPELVCNWDVPQLVLHFSGSSASGKNADLSAEFVVSSKILYFSFVVFCFKQADYSCVFTGSCCMIRARSNGSKAEHQHKMPVLDSNHISSLWGGWSQQCARPGGAGSMHRLLYKQNMGFSGATLIVPQ